ncbi:MAG: major rane immunogen [Oscillospiraceae bacterium]|nr:major rane immunogen [Oscillospiraceae bacterium]
MIKMRMRACIVCTMVLLGALCGCANSEIELKNGYYTAEMAGYSNGWKEFVTVHIKDDTILSVEYNAKNQSGLLASWDMAYMRKMSVAQGTYPNHYTRAYARQVIAKQSGESIDTVAGATLSGEKFRVLIAAALDMSRQGKNDVVIVQR